jgi:hypothetical protein
MDGKEDTMTEETNEAPTQEAEMPKPQSVQIAADAPMHVRVFKSGEDPTAEPAIIEQFEHSRNVLLLLPKLEEVLEPYMNELENITVTGSLVGVDPDTEQKAELALYNGPAEKVLAILRMRAISPDEAMIASRGFFGDMLDISDAKAILVTAVFGEGQASYVMLNKTVEVEPEHMFRLVATTFMQLDKFKQQMMEMGVQMPGADGGIVTPGQPGFDAQLGALRRG